MPDYRAYVLGPSGNFVRVHEIAADDHNHAIAAALKLISGRPIELWQGDEFVGTLKPGNIGQNPTFKRPVKRREGR